MMSQLRLLKWGAVLFLVTAVSFFLLIHNGFFDPKPVGEVVWEQSLNSLTVNAGMTEIQWLAQPIPANDFSVQLTAGFVEGGLDSDYGLILGDEQTYLKIAVSPLGYATIEHDSNPIFSRQPWPHVKRGNEQNEIWLNSIDGVLSVRLNRELIWVGEVEQIDGDIGLYAESFAETAVFDFINIEIRE